MACCLPWPLVISPPLLISELFEISFVVRSARVAALVPLLVFVSAARDAFHVYVKHFREDARATVSLPYRKKLHYPFLPARRHRQKRLIRIQYLQPFGAYFIPFDLCSEIICCHCRRCCCCGCSEPQYGHVSFCALFLPNFLLQSIKPN